VTNPLSSVQGVLAIIVVIGDFIVMGLYIALNRSPDGYIIALVSGSFFAVTGFFFGHANGSTSALAVAATALANRTNPGTVVAEALPSVPVVP
jgi:hypothetical protein